MEDGVRVACGPELLLRQLRSSVVTVNGSIILFSTKFNFHFYLKSVKGIRPNSLLPGREEEAYYTRQRSSSFELHPLVKKKMLLRNIDRTVRDETKMRAVDELIQVIDRFSSSPP